MTMMYCPNCRCNTNVSRWDTTSIIILIVLLVLGILLGLIYLIYKLAQSEKCEICGCPASKMEPPRPPQYSYAPPSGISPGTGTSTAGYCGKCGAQLTEGAMFCPRCGNEIKNQ